MASGKTYSCYCIVDGQGFCPVCQVYWKGGHVCSSDPVNVESLEYKSGYAAGIEAAAQYMDKLLVTGMFGEIGPAFASKLRELAVKP